MVKNPATFIILTQLNENAQLGAFISQSEENIYSKFYNFV